MGELHHKIDLGQARSLINTHIRRISPDLQTNINKALHDHPETCYKEFFAHDTLTTFLSKKGLSVTPKTYGLETSFEASTGQGGRQVVFCAEYDALPDIGHACGHNLIATSSIAAFLAAGHVLHTLNIPGRIRLLGTPAEEGGLGKQFLIDAGAFDPPEDIAAAIMAHPASQKMIPSHSGVEYSGIAGPKTSASHKFKVEFRGRTAHAAAEPWNGINSLDAAVSAYNSAAMLRQQIRPDERIHAVIEVGGTVQNVITSYSRMSWNVRSPSLKRADELLERVRRCIEGGAAATGCTVTYLPTLTSADLRVNEALCRAYVEDMGTLGRKVVETHGEPSGGSTDMGNVSHYVPSFHGMFSVTKEPDVVIHNPGFTACAATDEAHAEAMRCAKGMAMLAVRVLVDDVLADKAREDFKRCE
ncbi:metal-dependent amidase/aminoacylase/carboxypeptidase [Pochonia chlamydosporia 170]|uniref:Peptidase M20 domain-containing protein 2 n=1 Tax=Pochonia chlamydosporia 170 TaxID=1380566 RepID=A0A179F3P3_METCM|nr:metal-dependent amidase/aminoacylase/carboxypeptidase [Pochonia chlamydosporia 170]OAQ60047.1 metal-dependent amidase/aminoacylase/carboxypeptidase [Pochonia chlamydosporia 170]